MKPLLPLLVVLATFALPAPARAGAPADSAAITRFEGIWMFDAAHSDDPVKIMQRDRPQLGRGGGMRDGGGPAGGMAGGRGGRRHGGMGEGGSGSGGWGAGGARGGEPEGEANGDEAGQESANSRGGGDPRRAFERVMHPAKKLVIYVDRDRFQVEEDEAPPRVYTLSDSLKALGVKPLNDEATVRTDGRRLEAKQPLGRRGALVETYELSADGRTLTIRAHRVGGPEGMPDPVISRAYSKYDGE
jgi:hypothetical protein